ncbi:MAG TPA: PAS domain-containing protein [Polyangiaceae bacterium]|nr:PAS domain-containing protein [Polyangiaceae bacterium]
MPTKPEDEDDLRAENSRLRAQVAELTREVERLARWRKLAQATLDASPDMIYVRDPEYRYAVINTTCARYMGAPGDQILGTMDADFFSPALLDEFRANDREVLSTRQTIEEEQVVQQPDGAHTFVNRKFPIFGEGGEGGEVVAIGGITADITARRRAEASLRESQTLLQAILDNSPNLIVVTDREGRFLLLNREAARAAGRPEKDLLGKTNYDVFPSEEAAAIVARHDGVIATGETIQCEDTVTVPDGVRTYLNATFPLRDAQGNVYGTCALVTDITDRKRREEERERHREEVIQAQQSALRELSTPLIPFADEVVIMPLIGSVDAVRAQQALETLLEGTARHRASVAIVDITGVPNVDADVAHALLGAARAVQLLGATTILTGIRPEVARTLATLNMDLSGIVTQGTLQSGVAYALARRRERQPAR